MIRQIISGAQHEGKNDQASGADGIVIRPIEDKIERVIRNDYFKNDRVSFKAINSETLGCSFPSDNNFPVNV